METKNTTNLLLIGVLAVLVFSASNIYTFIESTKIEKSKEFKEVKNTKVMINSYSTYPVASGKVLNPSMVDGKNIQYILPNGTKGEIVKWHEKYTTLSSPFARVDMFNESEVKILNGPMKGKVLLINHIYITLMD